LSNIAPTRPYSTIISGCELHRLGVVDQDLRHRARLGGLDRIKSLHRLDDQQRLARRHLVADRDEIGLAGLGREIGGADHGRLHRAGMLAEIVGRGGRCRRGACRGGRCGRRRRDRCCHRHAGPGDPDTPLAVGQLDLAEIGLVKDLRQLADELGIHLELCHGETLRGECQRASRRDNACNARR
jgi:hypothetical protein